MATQHFRRIYLPDSVLFINNLSIIFFTSHICSRYVFNQTSYLILSYHNKHDIIPKMSKLVQGVISPKLNQFEFQYLNFFYNLWLPCGGDRSFRWVIITNLVYPMLAQRSLVLFLSGGILKWHVKIWSLLTSDTWKMPVNISITRYWWPLCAVCFSAVGVLSSQLLTENNDGSHFCPSSQSVSPR